MKNYGEKYKWEIGKDFPEWANTLEYVETITKGYLLEKETPRKAYKRIANCIANRLGKPKLSSKFFDYIWKGWLCLPTPVLTNVGTERGLGISCYLVDVEDSLYDIGQKNLELMMLAKNGGGVGMNVNRIRSSKSPIHLNGTSDGVVPFCKIYDSTILATNQGSARRGAASANLDIEHGDYYEFLEIREPKGDVHRQCLNLHQCIVISDDFMQKTIKNDGEERKRWIELIKKRKATGQPFILFKDNVNKANPAPYKKNNLHVCATNICTEITLFSDSYHSFVCCLSSLNLDKYEEWKDSELIYDSIWFLDGLIEDFIQRAKTMKGFENAVRHAEKGRALGLGVLGWHSLLQTKGIPFESLEATLLTNQIFSRFKEESKRASQDLAKEYGEPEWCKGTGFRNTHRTAIAPTTTNSKLAGGISPGIEPWSANVFTEQTFKGTFIRKNKILEKYLEVIGKNTEEVWDKILYDVGSVKNLNFLDEWGFLDGNLLKFADVKDENVERFYRFKDVFKTFKEINQLELVNQAGQRTKYIDQSMSLNLSFFSDASPKWINKVHLRAWEIGIKSLYYMKTESVLRGDVHEDLYSECLHCES